MPRLTAGPPDAKINPLGFRTYRWPVANDDGTVTERELLSVTSIRKLCGEPFGLVNWQIGKVIDRAMTLDYFDRLRALLRPSFPDEDHDGNEVDGWIDVTPDAASITEMKKWLRAATTEERDAAASKGLDIHGALELGLRPEDCNEETRPFVRQVRHFLDDTGYEIVAQEFQVFNLSVGYAGTGDVLFRRPDGKYVIGDWKTSKSVYVDHVVQLHAYLRGEFVGTAGVVDEALTAILNQTEDAGILHLSPDGWTWHDVPLREEVVRAFYGSVWFAQLLAEHRTPDALFGGTKRGKAHP